MTAKIKSISISGIRTLDNFKLDLNDGLTVLIGENGSGKSTIVEACELLRRTTNQYFWNEFNQIHGGEALLLRKGEGEIEIGIEGINDKGIDFGYQIAFGRNGVYSERQWHTEPGKNEPTNFLERVGEVVKIQDVSKEGKLSTTKTIISTETNFYTDALSNIDVHVPFATAAYWASQSQGGHLALMRDSVTVAPTDRLERLGANLPNAYHALRNEYGENEWEHTMDLVRLGLGQWVESVNTRADAGGGRVAIWLKVANTDTQIPSGSLSDGQLAYLAFVALARLPSERSLLVIDEIESHLHPRLLPRVMNLMRDIAERTPVLLTTHSRRLLDDLDEPAKSVRVLELDEPSLTTELRQFDEAKLKVWLDDYDGLGHVLDAGYPESLFQTESAGSR